MGRRIGAWIFLIPLVGGCTFDAAGIGPGPADRGNSADLPAVIDGQLDQPKGGPDGAPPLDGPPRIDAPRDLKPGHDQPPPIDLKPPADKKVAPDTPSPCIFEHFTASSMSSWKATPQQGSWVWHGPSSARQQQVNYFGAHALVQGSGAMVQSFSASTTCTVDKVYDNGYGQGGGLSLLVRKVYNNQPYRQVMCLTWLWASTGVAKLALAQFKGTSKSASSFQTKTLSWSPVGKAVTYVMTVKKSGGQWNASCTLTHGTKTETVSADVASLVDSAPLGVGLMTTGVTINFDTVEVCPGP